MKRRGNIGRFHWWVRNWRDADGPVISFTFWWVK